MDQILSAPKLKILLVEDNPGDVRLLEESLADGTGKRPLAFGLELAHASCLSEAERRLARGGIDAVLLDLSLPDSHGLSTINAVLEAAPEVPVVVLTGRDDESLALQALQAGAQDYLLKGQMPSHLLIRALRYAIERHQLQATVRSLSLLDELTGLYNRRGFFTLAERQLKLAPRIQIGLALVLADLDGLKQINDTFGHGQGDLALVKTAQVLRQTFRDSDIIARLAGDEFTVLVSDDSTFGGEVIQRRLREELNDFNAQAQLPHRLSLSLGIAHFDPIRPNPIEQLIAQADQAMYGQKRDRKLAQSALSAAG